MRLYELPAAYQQIAAMIEEADGEITPEIDEALAGLNVSLQDSAEWVVGMVRQLIGEQDALLHLANRAKVRMEARGRSIDRLRDMLTRAMVAAEVPKLTAFESTVSLRPGSLSVEVVDMEALRAARPDLVRTQTVTEPDKKAIGDELKAKALIPGVTLRRGEPGITIK